MESFTDYEPSGSVQKLHNVPRFGHSNSLAHLASPKGDEYTDGIVAFSVFLLTIVGVWVALLLLLKFRYGTNRVGCAAGGEVINIKRLKQELRLSKGVRKRRILRNWRVQTVCLLACLAILPTSMLLIQGGLHTVVNALEDIRQVNDEIDSRAYRGIQIVVQLAEAYHDLQAFHKGGLLEAALVFENVCPLANLSALRLDLIDSNMTAPTISNSTESGIETNVTVDVPSPGVSPTTTNVTTSFGNLMTGDFALLLRYLFNQIVLDGVQHIESFVQEHNAAAPPDALYQVTNATLLVDQGIDAIYENDWWLKMFVVVLDVVILYWIGGVLVAKQSVDWPAYQRIASLLVLPILCGLFVVSVLGTLTFASVGMINGDFCAGGENNSSPMGTIQEMIAQNGYNEESLPFDALNYYGSDCLATNPLNFLSEIEVKVAETHLVIQTLYSEINKVENQKALRTICGAGNNLLVTNATLFSLERITSTMRGTLTASLDLTDCSTILPVIRKLFFGVTCSQSVDGLAYLLWSMMAIVFLCLIVLSTRAAMFNPVIRGRRSKRREKEFEDYKEYMSRFYDTKKWNLDFIPDDEDKKFDIPTSRSADTQSTAASSPPASDEDGQVDLKFEDTDTEMAFVTGVPRRVVEERQSDGDSYDSTYSSDGDEASDMQSAISVISQFFQRQQQQHQHQTAGNSSLAPESSRDEILSMSNSMSSVLSREMKENILSHFSAKRKEDENSSQGSNEDDCDSAAGVIMTPKPVRYTSRFRRQGSSARRRREDPEDFEMVVLTPPQSTRGDEPSRTPNTEELKSFARRWYLR